MGGYLAVCNVTVEDDYVTDVTITPAGPETLPVGKNPPAGGGEVVSCPRHPGGPDRHLTTDNPKVATVTQKGLGHRSVRGHSGRLWPVQGGQQKARR